MAFIWSKLKLLKCQNVFNSFDILTIGQTASETDVSKRLSTLIAQKGVSGSLGGTGVYRSETCQHQSFWLNLFPYKHLTSLPYATDWLTGISKGTWGVAISFYCFVSTDPGILLLHLIYSFSVQFEVAGQRTAHSSQFSFRTWFPGTELKSSGLAAGTLPAEPSHLVQP